MRLNVRVAQLFLSVIALSQVVCGVSAYAQTCFAGAASEPVFQTLKGEPQPKTFTFEADLTPSADGPQMDSVLALGNRPMSSDADLAALVRFNSRGFVDVLDGAGFRAAADYRFSGHSTYHVRIEVDAASRTYSAFIHRRGVPQEVTLGTSLAFRTGQARSASLTGWGLFSRLGTLTVCNPVASITRPREEAKSFNGVNQFLEVPNSDKFSISTTGALTVSAWIRPDTLVFQNAEGSGYVQWLGKGQGRGANGQQEWAFRMYSRDNTEGRENRISFYVYNPEGGLGIGSHFQDPIETGEWIHVVGVADGRRTYIYKNGIQRDCDRYDGGKTAGCGSYSFTITPRNGTSPLRMGTQTMHSFFEGAMKEVRIWNRALTPIEIEGLYQGAIPNAGMVAAYLTASPLPQSPAPRVVSAQSAAPLRRD